MAYDAILTALADPTRRAVLDRLRDGPCAVGRIAEGLPVSRPAVSQHLRVLLDAGLVSRQARGTRNLYALTPGGAAPLVDWLGALSAREAPAPERQEGLNRSLTTRLSPAEAWQLFCEDLAIWWPVARVSLSARTEGALPQVVALDPVTGGALREVLYDGTRGDWAVVRQARAPETLVMDWRLATPEGSRVTVDFQAAPGGSRVIVAHDRDTDATQAMWDVVLERFNAAAASSLSNF
ncbi:metalloregulator ArsR/SmtB family transcription factor [Jannaschia sp. S6380]|uniref:ArsR/SmtB family transcription factor n=1 Tax=Jannaschia sp. S6380 TaxID=2926408 RepID=UPI001FF57027|nr:metalloregulator ArsR/SmtB family transcription factor [Jannaschia sp. S6380]MCK0166834.1 metalloregulator ArsR/SmtB family transcription factor [Jannaschia sp. S6380]